MQAGRAARDESDLLALGLGAHPVDGLGHHGIEIDVVGLDQRVPLLEAGELDDLLHEHAQARGLLAYAADVVADEAGVVDGALDGLRQEGDGPDRGLELMGDVGDEVAAHVLQTLGGGAVVDEDEDATASDGGHAHVQVEVPGPVDAPSGDGQLGVLGVSSRAHPRHHLGHARLADLVVPHNVEGVGGGGGAQHLIVVVQHDDGRAQRGQNRYEPAVLEGGARGDAIRAPVVGGRREGESAGRAQTKTHDGNDDQQHNASHTLKGNRRDRLSRTRSTVPPSISSRKVDLDRKSFRDDGG